MTCKSYTGRANINIYNGDCMEFMKDKPAKSYELCIVDPPYGIEKEISIGGKSNTKSKVKFHQLYSEQHKKWDVAPAEKVFEYLKITTNNQIIWGGNYFDLGRTRGFVVWDKKQMMPNFSRCEFAWTSFDKPAKIFEYDYYGNVNMDKDITKFHPTQKPVALYKWLLTNYAKQGDKILDTHGGSMSIAIACWDLGFDLDIIELDKDYYDKAVQRFERHINQKQIF